MTAQAVNLITIDGIEYLMPTSIPFTQCPLVEHKPENLGPNLSTATWAGYISHWAIQDNKLFLVKITGTFDPDQEGTYVLNSKESVFADWFSGDIRIWKGKLVQYVHSGWFSIYEYDWYFRIENGIVIKNELIDNRETPPGMFPEKRVSWNVVG